MPLISNVIIDNEWWGPAYDRTSPPAEVAERITNPACWDKPPAAVDVDDVPLPADLVGLDKDALLELVDAEDLDVNRRLGVDRLAEAIADARNT